MAVRPLLSVPPQIRAGEAFEVRILIQHPMETGFRRDSMGRTVAQDIINRFECSVDGQDVFSATLHPAISANPYLVFSARLAHSGTMLLRWVDDQGTEGRESVAIAVIG
jgi:thiosulfate oxidation carrier complex protein SoxZ